MLTRPMLAATLEDTSDICFPVLATPKFDGIRCITMGGFAFTRAFKLVPNLHVQRLLHDLPTGCDGELICGAFNDTQSAVMSTAGEPRITYFVFDVYHSSLPYSERCKWLPCAHPCSPVAPTLLTDVSQLYSYETACLRNGYEGVMLRDPDGPYKCGRSSLKEGYLLKFKRYKDAEAIVVGFVEQQENTNEAEQDAFGYTKRPGGKSNSLPKGTLGSLLLESGGTHFSAGSGFSDVERQHIWDNKTMYLGRVVTYRYQELGPNGRPRFPRIIGFRHD